MSGTNTTGQDAVRRSLKELAIAILRAVDAPVL